MVGQIGILDLLRLQGFDLTKRFKLVRHQEGGHDLRDFLRRGWLEAYQAFQTKPVFNKVDFVVSFIGVGRTKSRLVGVYEVLGCKPGHAGQLPDGCPHREWLDCDYFYEMRRLPGFEELEHRVVIEWGKGTRRWDQWPKNKEVVEILPKGQLLRPFDDYLGFTLTHSELKFLCSEPETNREWRARLSAVAGVYLVLATTTGAQYVGSAHGVEGFWGRWASYAKDGHGGNKLLKDLIAKDPAYPEAFSYSILQILPPTFARSEVLKREGLYKQKLGSRAVGLNVN
ncbi:MAG: GIY-YIG nuclease family protein [Dehalococcoidia bacterium]|nr:GIY-YIG nuclease family protein [Dehalococcoidia bacterium]